MPGLPREIKELQSAGFTDEEIGGALGEVRQEMSTAGFSDAEIDEALGVPMFDAEPVKDFMLRNLNEKWGGWTFDPIIGGGPATAEPLPDVTTSKGVFEAAVVGLQGSILGMNALQRLPTKEVPEDAPLIERLTAGATTLIADLPVFATGAFVGLMGGAVTGPGAPVMGMAGAFGLHAGMRRILIDKFEKGEATSFGELWERSVGAVADTFKGWLTGAGTALASAGAARLAAPLASKTGTAVARTGAEISAMVTIGSALEGRAPRFNDFLDAGIILGGLKGASAIARKTRQIYKAAGVRPEEVVRDVQQDPQILADLLSTDREIPKAYADAALDTLTQLRAQAETQVRRVEVQKTGKFVEPTPRELSLTELVRANQYRSEGQQITGVWTDPDAPIIVSKRVAPGEAAEAPTPQPRIGRDLPAISEGRTWQPRNPDPAFDLFSGRPGVEVVEQNIRVLPIEVLKPGHGIESPTAQRSVDKHSRALRETPETVQPLVVAQEPDGSFTVWSGNARLEAAKREGFTEVPVHIVRDSGKFFAEVREGVIPPEEVEVRARPGFLQTAEQRVEQRARGAMQPAEERIPAEAAKPPMREQRRFIEHNLDRSVKVEADDIARSLRDAGVLVGVEAPPKWMTEEPSAPPLRPAEVEAAGKSILSRIVTDRPKKRMTLRQLYAEFIDNLHPIFHVEKQKIKATGEVIETAESPYQLERLNRGVPGKASYFLKTGAFDFETLEDVGKSYRDILKPHEKDLDGFMEYAVARQAQELHNKGRKSGFDPKEVDLVVAAGTKYEKAFKERLEYRSHLLQHLVKSEILTPDRAKAMEEAWKNYVPFERFFEEAEGGVPSARAVRDPIKRRAESERKIMDPLVGDIKQTFLFIALADKNVARQKFVLLGPEYAQRVDKRSTFDKVDVQETLRARDELEGLKPEDFEPMHQSTYRSASNEIVVFFKGERQVYKVDPEVARAFNEADRVQADIVSKMLASPALLLRAGVVITPDFIARNLIRDAVSAFIYTGSHPIKTIKGLKSLVTQDTAFKRWVKGGGAQATIETIDRNFLKENLFALNMKTGVFERSWNVLTTPIRILQVTSALMENASRVGSVRKELLQAKTKAQIQALSIIARDSVVDFAKHGRNPTLQKYTRMTSFMNPGIQGMDRMVQAFKENPKATLAKSFASITVPSLLLLWANMQDPRWKQITNVEKDLFWIVMTDDAVYRIPKPFELGIVFGSIPERLVERFILENPEALQDFDKTMAAVFTFNHIPTIAVPLAEQFANRRAHTGGPLIPRSVEGLLPEYQYNAYTSETAKALAKVIGQFPGMAKFAMRADSYLGGAARTLTTPILIENYVRVWTGGMGKYALDVADAGLDAAGILPKPIGPLEKFSEMPVIRAFTIRYPSANTQSVIDFFDLHQEKVTVNNTFMRGAQSGDEEMMRRAMEFDRGALYQATEFKDVIMTHFQVINKVFQNPEVPPDEQRQIIDTMYANIIWLAEAGKTVLKNVEKGLALQPLTPSPQGSRGVEGLEIE